MSLGIPRFLRLDIESRIGPFLVGPIVFDNISAVSFESSSRWSAGRVEARYDGRGRDTDDSVPPHRSGRADFPHPAPALGGDAQAAGRIGMIAVTLALLGDFSSTTSLSDFPGSFIICAPKEHLKLTKYLVRIPRRGLVRTYPRLAWRLFLGFYSIRDRRSFSRRA